MVLPETRTLHLHSTGLRDTILYYNILLLSRRRADARVRRYILYLVNRSQIENIRRRRRRAECTPKRTAARKLCERIDKTERHDV